MPSSRLLLTILVCLLLALVASAQDFRATITGSVTDPSGAAIPGATVKATHIETKEAKEVKTTAEGYYTIPYLNPGAYNLEVAAPSFRTLKREGIVLRVADKLNLPLQLSLGQVAETVTVTAEQEVIETASADRGLVFDPVKTQEYPLNGRQTYMLLALTPGVIFTQEQFGPVGFSGTRGWDVNNQYKINGSRPGQSQFLLNGAPISDHSGMWQLAPNVEAVQEFKVMTNTYDAAFGRFGGGVVNTTLKSGTNNWHGDVFDYWRNSIFDANYYQNKANPNSDGTPKPKGTHNQHQFGGVLGGPIRKDKDFVFGSFEGWQEVIPFVATSTAPPPALRDGQHFTQFGYKIYDPLTTHVCDAKTEPCQGQTFIRNAFANNVIPQARLSPIGQKILSYYPAPNAPGIVNNFIANSNKGRYYYEQPMARWDHVFGDNDKFFATFTWQQGFENRDSTGFGPPAANGNTRNERHDTNIILDWTHVVSPTMVLDTRASFGRFVQTTPGYSDLSLKAQDLGMTQMIHAPTVSFEVVPQINLTNNDTGNRPLNGQYTRIFSSGAVLSWTPFNQWELAPSLTMTRGKHTLKTGVTMNYEARASISTGFSNGTFNFDSITTQQLVGRTQPGGFDGSSLASLLLGVPASGFIDFNDSQYRSRPYYAGYLQDDWKVTPRLTLNLGFRYDVQVPWLERYNRQNRGFNFGVKSPYSDAVLAKWATLKAQYDATHPTDPYKYPEPPKVLTGAFLFPGANGQPQRILNTDRTNIGPRVGVAYRLRNNTVLRAGGGVYYQQIDQLGTTSGFTQSTSYVTTLDGLTPSAGLTGPYSLVNPFPNGLTPPLGAAGASQIGVGGGVSFDDPNFRVPRTYQYPFGIQQQLSHRIVAEISYAGNYQNHKPFSFDTNSTSTNLNNLNKAAADNSFYSRALPNPFQGILPPTFTRGTAGTVSASDLMRPNPLFTNITNNLIMGAHYRSDALQVKVEQRAFGGGAGTLTWVLAYTFSKQMQADHRLNGFNIAEPLIYEVDDVDKPHNLAFHGVWDLPFGKGGKFFKANPVARAIAGDWRFDWIFTYYSGNPVGNFPNLNNVCGSWKAPHQDQYHWFNNDKSCYVQPPSNTLRTTPDRSSSIRDPQAPQLNVAVEKTIAFREHYKFQIRGEAFNLTNTPILPRPNLTFTSTQFGIVPSQQNNWPRICQVAAKFYF